MAATIHAGKDAFDSENKVNRLEMALLLGLQQLVDQHRLNPDLLARYLENIRHSLALVLDNPEHGIKNIGTGQPWGWNPTIESPDLSVGRLTIFGSQDIPLHDHPGSTGLLLVLQGQVLIRQYRMLDSQSASPLELGQTGTEELTVGQTSHFGPELNNVHTLHAVDGDCVLLDVLFNPYRLQQRSFFLPVAPQSGRETLFVSRLNKLRAGSIH